LCPCSVDSPFFVPRGKRGESGTAHKTFKSFHGDHLTLLNVYQAYIESGESKEWCTGHYLKPAVLVKARKVRNQLSDLLNKARDSHDKRSNSKAGLTQGESASAANSHGNGGVGVDESTVEVADEPEAVLRALASAFFLQTAQRTNRNSDQRRGRGGGNGPNKQQEREAAYALTSNGIGVNLHPSSSLFNRNPLPDWVVYHEVVRSSKMYLRGVSAVPKDLLLKEAPQYYKSKSMVDEGVKRKEEQERIAKRRRRAALMCD
jgi:HrpA-like RNA helicase